MAGLLRLNALLYLVPVQGIENLALGKPTWEQFPWPKSNVDYGSENAVDGNHRDRVNSAGHCTVSDDGKYNATWRVDLGHVVSVNQINIYYRTDNLNYPSQYNGRMAGFHVYVSNTTSKEDGHICFDDTQSSQGPPSEDQNITCSVLGRYVIYFNERRKNVNYPTYYSQYAYNELCELEVYGCNGTFGDDCFYPCPLNCLGRQCDTFTGQCNGCVPGYQGQDCSEECESGKYGLNCQHNCSNCQQDTRCNNVNGLCLQGCSPGYIGPFCNISCRETFYGINCSQPCSTKCTNQTCHPVSGICAEIRFSENKSKELKQVYIIGGIVGAFFVLSLIAGFFIVYKRTGCTTKKRCDDASLNNTETVTQETPNMALNFSNIYQNFEIDDNATASYSRKPADDGNDIDIDEKIHNENPYGDVYVNEKSTPNIAVRDLGNEISEKSKNEDDGFKKEYVTLFYGERFPCNVGKCPENVPKNRFKTTFPYDHSRVILDNAHADYINANYIDGLNEEKRYIAAQGPKPNTVSDFWSMVLQEDVDQIIMLTNLKEGRKLKCAQYWPDSNATMTCDNIVLTTIEERQFACYVVRKIRLTHRILKSSKTVTQYQYTAWPDHGTPDPLCLLLFRNYVSRANSDKQNSPLLVHCSAGIGRTGTYIAVDVLYEAGKKDKRINIAEYVKKMRQNRMNMVQTYEQYKTIFLALHEMYKAPAVALNTATFLKKLQTNKERKLAKEFQILLSVRPAYTDSDYKMALGVRCVKSSIRPLDNYIIYLTSNVPKRGNYINAIVAPSFTKLNAFIITHYPSPGDAVDFLRLITDHDSEVVVSMDPLHGIESTNQWFPTSTTSKTVSPFTIHSQEYHISEIKSCTIDIGNEKSSETWSVNVIQPSCDLKLDNPQTALQILSLVYFTKNIKTSNPIIVVSKDGAAQCGVFCAVYNLIQQLTMDEEIDVFSVVRLLQTRRPELCSTMEEYGTIHDALKNFIESKTVENVYYNQ